MRFPRKDYIDLAQTSGKSEDFISSTLKYANNLDLKGFPVIFSLKHLADTLNTTYTDMKYIITNRGLLYSTYKIRKKNGGTREIRTPNSELKFIQRWIYHNILKGVELDPSCKGFKVGTSIKQNAIIHVNKEAILNLDLYKFFDTILEKRVYYMFRDFGYHPNLAVDLAKLTTVPIYNINIDSYDLYGFLPQGAPTSPAISNIVLRNMDRRFRRLSESSGVSYSRYADDITFSGSVNKLPSLHIIETIISEEGFKLNKEKTRKLIRGQKQMVLGLTVSDGIHVPRDYKNDIWKHLYFCKKFGPEDHLKKIGKDKKSFFKEWLFGRIMYVNYIEPEIGSKMIEDFNKIAWII